MKGKQRFLAMSLSLLAILPAWNASYAASKVVGSFEEVVADAAVEVLKRTGNQPVSIGEFTSTGLRKTNSGPAIDDLLRKALEKINPASVKETGDAPFEVKGDYALRKVDRDRDAGRDKSETSLSDFLPDGLQVIELTFRVISIGTGEKKTFELARFVDDNKSIARLLQIAGKVDVGHGTTREDRLERNERIAELAKHPQSFVDPAAPAIIKSSKESPYAIEILAESLEEHLKHKDNPQSHHPAPLEARVDPKTGFAFVDVPRDFVYEIRLFNTSGQEAAAAVSIDGLDMFQFSDDVNKETGKPLYGHLVFDQEAIAVGWHKSVAKQRFDRFLVTEYGKGASAKTGKQATAQTGVIQVAFSRSSPLLPGRQKRSAGNETGFGPPEKVEQTPVEREITPPVDFVTVRYTR